MECEIVAVCEECGRKFITMPNDGRDHFYPANVPFQRNGNRTSPRECGGRVVGVKPQQ